MAIDKNEIEKRPLTTNKLDVVWDKEAFFEKYSVISYYSRSTRNIAYEQIASAPKVSVAGFFARWSNGEKSNQRFFVLTLRKKVNDVINELRKHEDLLVHSDTLEDYDEILQKRIVASLAVNALASSKNNAIYSNGALFLCDDQNFLVPKSRQELVCLKITVDNYLHLVAQTSSFVHPRTANELKKNCSSIFHLSKVKDGNWWTGLSVLPITIKNINIDEADLDEFFIQGKRFSSTHNLVNYWPYDKSKFNHGRLFALKQVVDSVNELFKDLLQLSFHQIKDFEYEEYRSTKDATSLLKNYMNGRSIYIEDPFKTEDSQQLIEQIKNNIQGEKLNVDGVSFTNKQTADCMILRLCEEKEEETTNSNYLKQERRALSDFNYAVQHITLPFNKEVKCSIAETRRDLLELLVKDCNKKGIMPSELVPATLGWEFIRYKLNHNFIKGASLSIESDGKMNYKSIGFKGDILMFMYDEFIKDWLMYNRPERLNGPHDYMVLKKDGNIYLIIDTDEIPILDAERINEAYRMIDAGEKKSQTFMKNKDEAPIYLRGYIGLNMWKSEDLEGNPAGAYSYISGFFWGLLNLSQGSMDKVPRVRRIFPLYQEHTELQEQHIDEIKELLKAGFGRWNELMTYPYPFKFLKEYLDDQSEISYGCHWDEITKNKELLP